MEELQALYDELETSIIWFNTKTEAATWFANTDWETKYAWGAGTAWRLAGCCSMAIEFGE